ncbi:Fungal specific transcription factor domain-containing protein [Cladophialophora immunda]|nr:Fungal specific transcription factor domain-containing protein [Cladophialophora immunda]
MWTVHTFAEDDVVASKTAQNDLNSQMREMQSVLHTLVNKMSPRAPNKQDAREGGNASDSAVGNSDQRNEQLWSDANPVRAESPHVRGPTSTEFTLDVVKCGFRAMGYDSTPPASPAQAPVSALDTGSLSTCKLSPCLRSVMKNPLWQLGKTKALQLIGSYTSGPGAMYPVLLGQNLIEQVEKLFAAVQDLKNPCPSPRKALASEVLLVHDPTTLQLVLAIGISIQKRSSDELMLRLYDSAQEELTRSLLDTPTTLQSVVWLILAAIFHFHLDDEHKAGKFVSMAARACLELGLHRNESILRGFPDIKERNQAVLVFWAVYILDRRQSSALGIPFVLQDIDFDATLMTPTLDVSSYAGLETRSPSAVQTQKASLQYVAAMVDFAKLSGKAIRIVNKLGDMSLEFPQEEVGFLDYQVQQWYSSLPDILQTTCERVCEHGGGERATDVSFYLRVVLKTRTCQLRNLLWRPVLYSTTRVSRNTGHARTAIEAAKETVLFLGRVNKSTTLLRSHPVFFKHFLINALGVLLLSIAHAWEDFGRHVSQDFYMALDLLRVLCAESPLIMRYWEPIQRLEKVAHRNGLERKHVSEGAIPDELSDMVASDQDGRHAPDEIMMPTWAAANESEGDMSFMDPVDFRADFATLFDLEAGAPMPCLTFRSTRCS